MDKKALLKIKDFESLLEFLVDDLEWPIPEGLGEYELTFVYTPEEIGLSDDQADKMSASVKQLRPFVENQPWAIFWLDFETKKMPVTVLRRILRHFVVKRRAANPDAPTWQMEDIMFVAGHGEEGARGVTFAHFKNLDGKEVMREFSWNSQEQSFDNYINYLDNLKWEDEFEDNPEAWKEAWRKAFTGSTREAVKNSKQLALAMAWIARDIRDRVKEVYEIEHDNGALHQLYDSFREGLIHDMSVDQFADMYAQTMTYGLFTARTMDTDGQFEMYEVADLIPSTNPFLKQLFKECLEVGTDHNQIDLDELGIGRLVDLLDGLNRSDGTDGMTRILEEFGRKTFGGNEDPVIHFYEEFLKEYDQLQRVDRGVYYTPDAVVDFIVRSVNEQLKSEFGLEMGLADTTTWDEMVASGRAEWPKDPKTGKTNQALKDKLKKRAFVQILDPATGTGTFLIRTITEIHAEVKAKHKRDNISMPWLEYWNEYVYKDLFPRLYGFELMMASYSVAHMRIGMHLKSLDYEFKKGQRLNIYLTNTLESPEEMGSGDLFYSSIGSESAAAKLIKQDRYFSVVIGNPPYFGFKSNEGQWINSQIDKYKYISGKNISERKHRLGNDYVKFIRYAQYLIEANGVGIIGFINDHGYLFNPTFRGMRWQIMNTFDKICILDLHGNSKKRETAANGELDVNVFDIQQGVSINLFVRKKSSELKPKVLFHDLLGSREKKYKWLIDNVWSQTDYIELDPQPEFYLLEPIDLSSSDTYNNWFKVDELFPLSVTGTVTGNDDLLIGNNIEQLTQDLQEECHASNIRAYIKLLDYRPFDKKCMYFIPNHNNNPIPEISVPASYRSRYKKMKSMESSNFALVVGRQGQAVGDMTWNVVFISNRIVDLNIFYRGGGLVCPLFIETKNEIGGSSRIPNLNQSIVHEFENKLECKIDCNEISPLNILDYIYAVLHSPTYRENYKEFLKIDFPRIPYPKDKETFRKLVFLGGQLRQIHLLESNVVNKFITEFPVAGTNEVTKSMTAKSPGSVASEDNPEIGDVWINDDQYFSGVPKIAWEFYIGGYQPAQKWLKDRKGRNLSQEDIEHYQKIIVALTETDRIMQEIDKIEIE